VSSPGPVEEALRKSLHQGTAYVGVRLNRPQMDTVVRYVMPALRIALSKIDYERYRRAPKGSGHVQALTHREHQTLIHMVWGHSAPDTARFLGISEQSVRTHRRRIFHKLCAKSATDAIVRAHVLGVINISTIAAERPAFDSERVK
jgi:DNA-binding CsgD family transcriptional regulator